MQNIRVTIFEHSRSPKFVLPSFTYSTRKVEIKTGIYRYWNDGKAEKENSTQHVLYKKEPKENINIIFRKHIKVYHWTTNNLPNRERIQWDLNKRSLLRQDGYPFNSSIFQELHIQIFKMQRWNLLYQELTSNNRGNIIHRLISDVTSDWLINSRMAREKNKKNCMTLNDDFSAVWAGTRTKKTVIRSIKHWQSDHLICCCIWMDNF